MWRLIKPLDEVKETSEKCLHVSFLFILFFGIMHTKPSTHWSILSFHCYIPADEPILGWLLPYTWYFKDRYLITPSWQSTCLLLYPVPLCGPFYKMLFLIWMRDSFLGPNFSGPRPWLLAQPLLVPCPMKTGSFSRRPKTLLLSRVPPHFDVCLCKENISNTTLKYKPFKRGIVFWGLLNLYLYIFVVLCNYIFKVLIFNHLLNTN